MSDTKGIADHNCAAKVLAALLDDGFTIVPNVEDANEGADKDPTHIYICIDMGESGVICIKRPRQGRPATIKV